MSRFFITIAFVSGLIACQADRDVQPARLAADCLVKASASNGQTIAGAYVVSYPTDPSLPGNPNARFSAVQTSVDRLLTRHHIADDRTELLSANTQTNFLAHLTAAEAADLQRDPTVSTVEPDRITSICSYVGGGRKRPRSARSGHYRGQK